MKHHPVSRFLNTFIVRMAVAAVATITLHSVLPAQDLPSNQTFVLDGMKGERDKLTSGICTVTLDDSTTVAIHFSEPRQSLRMDWHWPVDVARNYVEPEVDLDPDISAKTGYFIRKMDSQILWFQGKTTLNISHVDAGRPGWAPFFDLKAIGFYSWLDYKQQLSWETLYSATANKPVFAIHDLGEGKREIVRQIGGLDMEWRITVDCQKGFAPIKAVFRQRTSGSENWFNSQVFETGWKEVSGVWVPVHWRGFWQATADSARESVKMTIDWESVNRTIPSEIFTYHSIDLPEEITILDSTMGQIVEIKNRYQPLERAPAPETRSSWLRIVLVILGVGVIACLLIWFIKK